MRKTESRNIILPVLVDFNNVELNAKLYDYARRTAVLTLEEYVIEPFKNTLKERAFENAKREVGLNSRGILKKPHTEEWNVGGIKFVVKVEPSEYLSYENVLSSSEEFLDIIMDDNYEGVHKEYIRKINDNAYVSLKYLLEKLEGFKKENTKRSNRELLSMKNPKTDKNMELDDDVKDSTVYLENKKYVQITENTVLEFYRAVSLKRNIEHFMREFEEKSMEQYKNNNELDFSFEDGTSFRYLFFEQSSTKYGEVYSSLVGKETENITYTTGDLDIIKDLSFSEPYKFKTGNNNIEVETAEITMNGKLGKIRIKRTVKGKNDIALYNVYQGEKDLYIQAFHLNNRIKALKESNTATQQRMKIDFYAPFPKV